MLSHSSTPGEKCDVVNSFKWHPGISEPTGQWAAMSLYFSVLRSYKRLGFIDKFFLCSIFYVNRLIYLSTISFPVRIYIVCHSPHPPLKCSPSRTESIQASYSIWESCLLSGSLTWLSPYNPNESALKVHDLALMPKID